MSTEELKEKTINFWIRFILRAMAWVTLMVYMVFRVIIPVISGDKVYLDKNDGYLMGGSIILLLAIEGVKKLVEYRLDKMKEK